jgi:hypothetical protein
LEQFLLELFDPLFHAGLFRRTDLAIYVRRDEPAESLSKAKEIAAS